MLYTRPLQYAAERGLARLFALLPGVDRDHIGQIVSVEIGDNRAAREWLDLTAAKQIEVVEAGLGIGIEEGVALMLDKGGWVQTEAGATAVGTGMAGGGSRADVIVLDEVTDEASAWIKMSQPSIVVTRKAAEPVEGAAFVSAETHPVELIFDGVQWGVYEAP